MNTDVDVLILGGGLAGLAAGATIGDGAAVLERDDRPGGLVRTTRFGEYWFDHVVHLLYFPDLATQERVQALAGEALEPCTPRAMIDFGSYAVPYPFQANLHAVPEQQRAKCIRDFSAIVASQEGRPEPVGYGAQLERAFGRAMCELFFFPYNEKMWRRPLDSLATSGFHWNLAQPSFDDVLRGAVGLRPAAPYNGRGWYPQPPRAHPVRGMEVLSRSLAARVSGLQLGHAVQSIDLDRREVTAFTRNGECTWSWNDRCLSSLPLTALIRMCDEVPRAIRDEVKRLPHNRVRSVALSIEGPRPSERGHWRYYPSPDVCFTRLIHMCEFDPGMAPARGWSILAEITERAEDPRPPADALIRSVGRDIDIAHALPSDCRIVDAHVIDVDPAYVVFTPESAAIVDTAHAFLRDAGIEPIGRYGRWEYSSMAQVLRDSFAVADTLSCVAAVGP